MTAFLAEIIGSAFITSWECDVVISVSSATSSNKNGGLILGLGLPWGSPIRHAMHAASNPGSLLPTKLTDPWFGVIPGANYGTDCWLHWWHQACCIISEIKIYAVIG